MIGLGIQRAGFGTGFGFHGFFEHEFRGALFLDDAQRAVAVRIKGLQHVAVPVSIWMNGLSGYDGTGEPTTAPVSSACRVSRPRIFLSRSRKQVQKRLRRRFLALLLAGEFHQSSNLFQV
jgi:hypothetical protein